MNKQGTTNEDFSFNTKKDRSNKLGEKIVTDSDLKNPTTLNSKEIPFSKRK
jgi:hypothetical protein